MAGWSIRRPVGGLLRAEPAPIVRRGPMAELWGAIERFFGLLLSAFYQGIHPLFGSASYGVAIILLTIVTRAVIAPLGVKQIRSMQQMQKLQPKVKELQKKYKGDRQKLNEEMMKLYKEHGANPLGGCIPMLAQFPVFIALYAVIRAVVPVAGIADAALPKSIDSRTFCPPHSTGKTGGGARVAYYVLVALMAGTTYFQQRQMTQRAPAGQQQQQMKMMSTMMPVIFGFLSLQFPAALSIYWVTGNVWTIAQQKVIFGKQEPAKPEAPQKKGKKKP